VHLIAYDKSGKAQTIQMMAYHSEGGGKQNSLGARLDEFEKIELNPAMLDLVF